MPGTGVDMDGGIHRRALSQVRICKPPLPIRNGQIFLKDAQCAETNEKSIFRFLFLEILSGGFCPGSFCLGGFCPGLFVGGLSTKNRLFASAKLLSEKNLKISKNTEMLKKLKIKSYVNLV